MQRIRRRLLLGVVGGGLTLLVGAAAPYSSKEVVAGEKRGGGDVPVSACKRSPLTRPPLWTGSGVWNGEDLVLVDTVGRGLLPYSADGQARLEPPGPLSKALTKLYPMRIAAGGDGRLVIQADANRFLTLDRGYAAVGNVSAHLTAAQDRSGSMIDKVFTWTLAGQDVVAFADVRPPGLRSNEWATGIVRFSAETEKSGFEFPSNMNRPIDADAISRKYHRLGYAYITSLGDTAFYILMDSGAYHLWRYEKGNIPEDLGDLAQLVISFQGLWRDPSDMPSYVTPQDYVTFMETVEESSMPTGLYGWRDPASGSEALYLLSRQSQNGATRWLLTKLDPNSGRGMETVLIRSDANHLFAVPGPNQWAIVEKGPAVGLQKQEVKSIYTIPAERVRRSFEALKVRGSKEPLDICQ
jgi:hypothetical protein